MMDIILYVSGVLVLIICIVLIFFMSKGEKLINLVYKFNMCDKEIVEFLNIKESLILRVIGIIERELKSEFKLFDEVKNIKVSKPSSYDKDSLLTCVYDEISKIYMDNPNLKEIKSFDGIIKDINKNEVKLISLRTLYNKCAGEFNGICKKFPYNIICRIKKYKERTLYEGKELNNEIEKELNFVV